MIELKDIDKSYGTLKVFDSISLSIRDGEIMTIVGPLSLIHISEPTRP